MTHDKSNIDTANIERAGVYRIGLFFEENGWTFREQTCDFGIDAYVEQKIGGKRSNRHIALQIKSGESYIKVKRNGKITFTIDPWHYSYWLQSDRPVLILLYDPETKNIYWEQVRLAIIEQAKKYKKIEISASKILNEGSLEEFNDIIDTYVRHNVYEFDKSLVNFDSSIALMQEYTNAIKNLVDSFEQFSEKFKAQLISLNTNKLALLIDVFARDVRNHIDEDYALLHKSCWYLAYLAYNIDDTARPQLIEQLDDYINNLILNKAAWLTATENLNILFHPNIPKKIQRSNKKLIQYIENYAALIDLSFEDFIACKIINEQHNNG